MSYGARRYKNQFEPRKPAEEIAPATGGATGGAEGAPNTAGVSFGAPVRRIPFGGRAWPPEDLVALGQFLRPHGVAGQLRLHPFTRTSEELIEDCPSEALVWWPDGTRRPCVITAMSAHQQIVLVTLDGVTSRPDSEALRGAFLCVTEDQRWSLPRGQYYMDDLAGLEAVESGKREPFGTICRVVEGAAHDHLEIQCSDTPEPVLVPFIRQFVRRIDLKNRRMVLDLPPGLLEINRRDAKNEE